MYILLSLLFAVIGACFYLFSGNVKWATLGLVTFGCGLHAFLFKAGEPLINLLGGGR